MTDAQIEAVARLYCRKLGVDPDERDDTLDLPYWEWNAHRAREFLAMSEAVAEVRATVTEGGV